MSQPQAAKYTMTISRMTIDKLGIKLYDKVSAVLAELIANCYDADAEHVTVSGPLGKFLAAKPGGELRDQGYEIVVEDDGHGMTEDEVNAHYLKVGIDRRTRPEGGNSREKQRPVMGRKGIGKLAPFGICREMEVVTAAGPKGASEFPVANFILRYEEIATEEHTEYHPMPGPLDGKTTSKRGTRVILRQFDHRKVPSADVLHRQLAARFGLARGDWGVSVADATKETSGFELEGGELPIAVLDGTRIEVDDRPVELESGGELVVRGWVAYAKEAYKDEVMAGVRIYARGKIVSQTRDFNIPSGFTGEYKLRSYLVGYIEADWIDDEEEDLIRSDRQDIIWNSERGEAFQRWGQELLRELAGKAETSVRTRIWDEFLEVSAIQDRAKRAFPNQREFQQRVQDIAKLAIRGASRDSLRDGEYIGRVVDFAISVAPHRALLDNLREVASDQSKTLDTVVALFAKVRLAEIYSLGQVARERIASVKQLQGLINTATTERPLQELIEEAPWIIHPDWTPIIADRPLAEFRSRFEDWYRKNKGRDISTTTIGRPTKEPDFIFISDNRRMEIVEIKKPDWSFTDAEFDRAYGYLDSVRGFRAANQEIAAAFDEPRLLVVCDHIGCKNPAYLDHVDRDEDVQHRTWQTILHRTRQAHSDFLEVVDDLEKIAEAAESHESDEQP